MRYSLILVFAFATGVLCFPESRTDKAVTGRVPLEKDAESYDPPNESGYPFGGFLGGFNDMFEQMRRQMMYLLSAVPRIGTGNLGDGNTTSVTKVINGHKVVINETVYESPDGESASGVLKVRIVDIRPESGELPEGGVFIPEVPEFKKGSVESIEESQENEIPKRSIQKKRKIENAEMLQETERLSEIESFDYPNNIETFEEASSNIESFDETPNFETFEQRRPFETFDEPDNNIETYEPINNENVIDLSNDIYVNELAANQGWAPHPDAEVFQPIRRLPAADLSTDTRINEFAEFSGFPQNPNAEIIKPLKLKKYYYEPVTENS